MSSQNIEIELNLVDRSGILSPDAQVNVEYAPRIPISGLNMSWQKEHLLGWPTYRRTVKWKHYKLKEFGLESPFNIVSISLPRTVSGPGFYVADWITIEILGRSISLHPQKKDKANNGNSYVAYYPLLVRLHSGDLRFEEFPRRDQYYLDPSGIFHLNPAFEPAYVEQSRKAWSIVDEHPGKPVIPASDLKLFRLDGRAIHKLEVYNAAAPTGWQIIKVSMAGPNATRRYDLFYLYEKRIMRSLRVDDYYESGGRRMDVYEFSNGNLVYSQAPNIWSYLYQEQGISSVTAMGETRPSDESIRAIKQDFDVLARYLE